MRERRRKLSRHSEVASAVDYMLKRWRADKNLRTSLSNVPR